MFTDKVRGKGDLPETKATLKFGGNYASDEKAINARRKKY